MRNDPKENIGQAEAGIRSAVQALAGLRERPCLAIVGVDIDRSLLLSLRGLMEDAAGDAVDVVLFGHGGTSEGGYLVSRELRRRFGSVTIFVPLCAKSAATLLCLAADELVVGDLGELGPLDPQRDEQRLGRTAEQMTALLSARAVAEVNDATLDLFGKVVERLSGREGVSPPDAVDRASQLAGRALGPLYAQIDPFRVAEHSRALEVAYDYTERVLRGRHSELSPEATRRIATTLISGYGSHGFVIDREELAALGVPARAPQGEEVGMLNLIASTLIECSERARVCGFFWPDEFVPPLERPEEKEGAAPGGEPTGVEGA